MHLLDTATIIDFLHGEPKATEIVNRLEKTSCISAITVAELWDSKDALQSAGVESFIDSAEVLPFTKSEGKRASKIASSLSKKGRKAPFGDILIAATALAHGATIVTRDEHFTRIEGLTVLKY